MKGWLKLSVKFDSKALMRRLDDIGKKQLPFAVASALTAIADDIRDGEVDAFRTVFERPSPFTTDSIGVKPARKSNLEAWVFVKDKTARYLEPYELGGSHVLPGKALLNPKNVGLNQYGQMPRGTLAKLLQRPNTFAGSVTFKKSGQTVSGVWERPTTGKRRDGSFGTKGNTHQMVGGARTGLKLLVRFGDALPVRKRLDYRARAAMIVSRNFERELQRAMAQARITSR